MQWKVIREANGDLVTLRVGTRGEADYQELTLALCDWVRVAESIADLDRPGPPSSWFGDAEEPR
jgi:hypothetical protein